MKLRTYLCIIFFIMLAKCNTQPKIEINLILPVYTIDTIPINNHPLIRITKDGNFNCLTSIKGDTIIASENYYSRISFLDIDEDGCDDIRVFVFSNTPNECSSYLFDTEIESFRLIQNCYTDIRIVKETSYFYSYNAAGCADMNWESYLSKIHEFKLVHIGYIYGQGCDSNIKKEPQVIKIYKAIESIGGKKELIEELPYGKNIPQFEDKWDFIKNYWKEHYANF